MPIKTRSPLSTDLTETQINAFRLRRHHLLDPVGLDPAGLCRDVCGVQAQMMSAAQLQLWARNDSLTRTQIEDALWKSRTLVKTHLMRRTLHLIASSDFWLYISALRRSRTTRELRVMQRCNIAETEAREVAALIVQTLEPGPMTAN